MKIIIGGSGYMGKHLCKHFSRKNHLLAATCDTPKKDFRHFNLLNPDLKTLEIDLTKAKHVIICAGITKLDDCKKNAELAYKINVEGTKKLISQCFELGLFPVFISSDQVFDGKKGNYAELDKTNPLTNYGKHKKEIEDFLLNSKKPFLVVRTSKSFSLNPEHKTILTSWKEQLENNETIRCAIDEKSCPTFIEDLVLAIDLALEKNLSGIYNIVSSEVFSRFGLVSMLKSQLEIDSGKIIASKINDFDFSEERPLNINLNNEKFVKATNFKFTNMKECIDGLKKSDLDLWNLDDTGKSPAFFSKTENPFINQEMLNKLKKMSINQGRVNMRFCLQKSSDENLQDMVILAYRDKLCKKPHKHTQSNEAISLIEGEMLALMFDDNGKVISKTLLKQDNFIYRNPQNKFHLFIPVTDYIIYREVIGGNFQKSIFTEWDHVPIISKIYNELGLDSKCNNEHCENPCGFNSKLNS